jgi:hypothetical protein
MNLSDIKPRVVDQIMEVVNYCEIQANGINRDKPDPVKERREAYLKVAEKLRQLAEGRYVKRLKYYGD